MSKKPFDTVAFLQLAGEASILSWWRLRHRGAWIAKASAAMKEMFEEAERLKNKVSQQQGEIKRLKIAETLEGRILTANGELARSKGNRAQEDPYCVVVSPYQYEQWGWAGKHPKYAGLKIITAKGVSGPVVMTETAFMAFSRNAPELNITLKS